jgi:DNA repair exonuclease SbcCD ATPase subunit
MDKADEEIRALEEEKEASPEIQRLKEEIENVKVGEGFDVDKAEKIKALNGQISQTAKAFDTKIAASKAKKEAAKKLLNKREKNLESALDTFEKSLGANAVYGAFEPAAGQAAAAPAPAPAAH